MSRPTPNQITHLIAAARDVDELRTALASEGVRIRSARRLRRWLRRSWRRAHAGEIARLRNGAGMAFGSASPIVVRNGVSYRICGLAHGQRRFARLSPRASQAVAGFARQSDRPPTSDYATERGMARLLGLPRSKELDYRLEFLRTIGAGAIAIMVVRLLLLMPLLPFFGVLVRLSRDPVTRHIPRALDDPDQIVVLEGLYRATELPPSIAVGLQAPADRFRIAHSEVMAKELIERAEAAGLSEMVAIVGIAHVAEIEWFLSRAAR